MNIIEEVITSINFKKFDFEKYDNIYDSELIEQVLIEQLDVIIKLRKKTTNLKKVYKKII